jgi:hypothetical protein
MDDVARRVADWLPLFFAPGDALELRFLGVERPGRTHAGWITADQIPAVAGTVAALARISEGTYFTPQRLDPAVLSRAKRGHFGTVHRDRESGKCRPEPTTDADVLARRFLIVDVDPVRPAGVCATDVEKAAAGDVAASVQVALCVALPDPLVVDSGNGFHLYYRLPAELPGGPADAATDPLARLLALLARRCDSPAAKVDMRVYNAARIVKVPGTWARKGPNTPARPHRQSAVIGVPNGWRK